MTGILIYFLVYQRTHKLLLSQEELNWKDDKLQEKTQHYQSLFNYNTDGVFEITMDGKLASVNPEGEAIVGFSLDQLKGMDLSSLISPDEIEMVGEHFLAALKGETQMYEVTIFNAAGQQRLTRCSFIPIVVNGKINGVFSILRDITESEEMKSC